MSLNQQIAQHNQGCKTSDRIGAEAYTGLPGAFANLFPAEAPRDVLLAVFLAYAGCWLGRGVWTSFLGELLFPALYLLLAGSWSFAPALRSVGEVFGVTGNLITVRTGIGSALSLIFHVRDVLYRPEKTHTELVC